MWECALGRARRGRGVYDDSHVCGPGDSDAKAHAESKPQAAIIISLARRVK